LLLYALEKKLFSLSGTRLNLLLTVESGDKMSFLLGVGVFSFLPPGVAEDIPDRVPES